MSIHPGQGCDTAVGTTCVRCNDAFNTGVFVLAVRRLAGANDREVDLSHGNLVEKICEAVLGGDGDELDGDRDSLAS